MRLTLVGRAEVATVAGSFTLSCPIGVGLSKG